ncbi:short chain dehydrogenase family protein, partial [Bacteroides fragilis str. S23 R14]
MNRFENKIIIITGAAGGIGASTTRRIVSEGGKVVIADYSREKADQFAAELSNSGA